MSLSNQNLKSHVQKLMYNLHSLINWKWQNLILLTLIWQGLQAQVTQALRTVKTRRRYGLTGTALQNNMTELWSILDWSVRWWIKPNINTFSLSLSLSWKSYDNHEREITWRNRIHLVVSYNMTDELWGVLDQSVQREFIHV